MLSNGSFFFGTLMTAHESFYSLNNFTRLVNMHGYFGLTQSLSKRLGSILNDWICFDAIECNDLYLMTILIKLAY